MLSLMPVEAIRKGRWDDIRMKEAVYIFSIFLSFVSLLAALIYARLTMLVLPRVFHVMPFIEGLYFSLLMLEGWYFDIDWLSLSMASFRSLLRLKMLVLVHLRHMLIGLRLILLYAFGASGQDEPLIRVIFWRLFSPICRYRRLPLYSRLDAERPLFILRYIRLLRLLSGDGATIGHASASRHAFRDIL